MLHDLTIVLINTHYLHPCVYDVTKVCGSCSCNQSGYGYYGNNAVPSVDLK